MRIDKKDGFSIIRSRKKLFYMPFEEDHFYESVKRNKELYRESILFRMALIEKLMYACQTREHLFYKKCLEVLPKFYEELKKGLSYRFDTKIAIDNFLFLPELKFYEFIHKLLLKSFLFSGSAEIKEIINKMKQSENIFEALYDAMEKIDRACLYEKWIVKVCDQYIDNADNYEYFEYIKALLNRKKDFFLHTLAKEVEEQVLSYQLFNSQELEQFDFIVKTCVLEHQACLLKRKESIEQFAQERGFSEDHEWIQNLQNHLLDKEKFYLLLKTYKGIDYIYKVFQKGIAKLKF